jgi:uncharacterized membrane protein (DUF2068 family)
MIGRRVGLRAVALFEAGKGLTVLVAGSGVLLLVHRNVQAIAERLVLHLHLNPASRYPRIFLHVVTEATPGRLRLLALSALAYATLRFFEAWGLGFTRRWAEWMGVITGLVYVPVEARAMIRRPGVEPAVFLVLNLAIVLFLGYRLRSDKTVAG